MNEELAKLIEGLSDWDRGKRSGAHWGGGHCSPASQPFLGRGLDYHLGRREAHEAARDVAEQRLLCGRGKDLPRWTLKHKDFVVAIFPDPNRPDWYCCQHTVAPGNATNRTVLLEYGDFIGRAITITQNPQGIGFNPVRGSDHRCIVLENDYWSFRVDAPYAMPRLYDLVAAF